MTAFDPKRTFGMTPVIKLAEDEAAQWRAYSSVTIMRTKLPRL